jgi:hypothetical protein
MKSIFLTLIIALITLTTPPALAAVPEGYKYAAFTQGPVKLGVPPALLCLLLVSLCVRRAAKQVPAFPAGMTGSLINAAVLGLFCGITLWACFGSVQIGVETNWLVELTGKALTVLGAVSTLGSTVFMVIALLRPLPTKQKSLALLKFALVSGVLGSVTFFIFGLVNFVEFYFMWNRNP